MTSPKGLLIEGVVERCIVIDQDQGLLLDVPKKVGVSVGGAEITILIVHPLIEQQDPLAEFQRYSSRRGRSKFLDEGNSPRCEYRPTSEFANAFDCAALDKRDWHLSDFERRNGQAKCLSERSGYIFRNQAGPSCPSAFHEIPLTVLGTTNKRAKDTLFAPAFDLYDMDQSPLLPEGSRTIGGSKRRAHGEIKSVAA